jgi:hypothetical protein
VTHSSTSSNELNTTLTPHGMIHGDACFAYFNEIWGIPRKYAVKQYSSLGELGAIEFKHEKPKGR